MPASIPFFFTMDDDYELEDPIETAHTGFSITINEGYNHMGDIVLAISGFLRNKSLTEKMLDLCIEGMGENIG